MSWSKALLKDLDEFKMNKRVIDMSKVYCKECKWFAMDSYLGCSAHMNHCSHPHFVRSEETPLEKVIIFEKQVYYSGLHGKYF